MTDDKSKRGTQDRTRVSAGEGYEVEYFARKHGLSVGKAKELIQRFGPDRAKLDAEAEKIKGK